MSSPAPTHAEASWPLLPSPCPPCPSRRPSRCVARGPVPGKSGAGRGETQRAYKRGKTSFQGFGDFRRTAVRPTGRARGRRAGRLRRTIVAASFVTHGRRPRRTRAVRATPVVCTHAPLSGEYPKERLIFIPRKAGDVFYAVARRRAALSFSFFYQRVSPDVWGRIRRRDRCPSRPCSASVVHRDVLRASRGHRAPHASGLSLNTPREDR